MSAAVDNVAERLAEHGLLGERQAQVYVYRVIEGQSPEQTAAELGIAVKTVNNSLYRARQKLRGAEATLELIDDLGGSVPDD
jgi:DNA-directed RNA polymerase specialized sigma24 family protein